MARREPAPGPNQVHEAAFLGFQLGRMAQRDGNADEMELALAESLEAGLAYSEARLVNLRLLALDEVGRQLRTKRNHGG